MPYPIQRITEPAKLPLTNNSDNVIIVSSVGIKYGLISFIKQK